MKRTPTQLKPDLNLPDVGPNDIGDNVIESRHIAKDEIDGVKVSTMDDAIGAIPVVFEVAITEDATAGIDVFGEDGAPFKFEIVDVVVQCRAANASGTATVRATTTAVTDAIVMAVDKVVVRAGTIDDAQSVVAAGATTLNVITNGAADRGLVLIYGIKRD